MCSGAVSHTRSVLVRPEGDYVCQALASPAASEGLGAVLAQAVGRCWDSVISHMCIFDSERRKALGTEEKKNHKMLGPRLSERKAVE